MRKSKYLFKTFDHNWTCTYVGIASVVGAYRKGSRTRNSRPGRQTYYYIFERPTSDGKADKLIRLNHSQAVKVWRGEREVEDYSELRRLTRETKFTQKVSYHFTDKENKA